MTVTPNREPAQPLAQITADVGLSESRLQNWMKTADIGDGVKPGNTSSEHAHL